MGLPPAPGGGRRGRRALSPALVQEDRHRARRRSEGDCRAWTEANSPCAFLPSRERCLGRGPRNCGRPARACHRHGGSWKSDFGSITAPEDEGRALSYERQSWRLLEKYGSRGRSARSVSRRRHRARRRQPAFDILTARRQCRLSARWGGGMRPHCGRRSQGVRASASRLRRNLVPARLDRSGCGRRHAARPRW